MQLLHTGQNHWDCVSSIGCIPGTVRLFDSPYHDIISQEVEDQVKDLVLAESMHPANSKEIEVTVGFLLLLLRQVLYLDPIHKT